jgi:flagellin-like hook-associated protein FlgL
LNLSDPTLITVQDVLDAINNSGLDITASINADGAGIQVENDDPNRSFSIEEVGTGRAAKQMGLYGASDMMSTLLVLNNALENNDQEALSLLLDELDSSITVALENRASVGARSMRLEITSSRLADLKLNFTSLLSEVEDADMTQVITDLATQESMYQAALSAASRIIQPSLLDFLD